MKKRISFLSSFIFLLSSCAPYSLQNFIPSNIQVGEEFIAPFNTEIIVTTYSKKANELVNKSFNDLILSLHKDSDRYYSYEGINNVYTLNEKIGNNEDIKVSDDLFNIIKEGVRLTKLTKGIFNICLGDVIDLYTPKLSDGSLSNPTIFEQDDITRGEIGDVLQCVPQYDEIDNYVVLNETNRTVKLNKMQLTSTVYGTYKLSLGAYAKGYALDKLVNELNIKKYPGLISMGRSSIEFVKEYPGKESSSWRLKYSNPSLDDFKDESLFTLEFKEGLKVSTSSDSEKHYVIKNGDDYLIRSHILDGRSGTSNHYYRQVSVFSKDCPNYVLDVLSTTLFNLNDMKSVNDMVKLFEEEYKCSIDYLLVRPYQLSDINKYNISVTKKVDEMIKSSTKSSSIKKYEVVDK